MRKKILQQRRRQAIERLRSMRRKARRAVTLALVTLGITVGSSASHGQTGQTAMAPASGVAARAIGGFRDLNQNGPGIFYYGVNAADRGLGYVGSYMTVGGFVPAFEDDLGGFWSADLRGHLSVNGGFFSNVGAIRKQFIGGSLLGLGIYWDYDGDTNQNPDTTIVSNGRTYAFSGGQAYNQVGISGEWLTDWGNLRTNGYIPVGSTAETFGPFVGNAVLCNNGINAALGGVDLELGAYVPGLTDWAGMVSVGGYAYGNTRYTQPQSAAGLVPWFGGVYTRLDMTFVENWDFSLQANNDSYFDWTGFARLTYRMGGSRRRNVPDQVEQPMMRNEHIVRAHQAPLVATNPNNVDPTTGAATPWQVFHVDNSAPAGGDGTAESPFRRLSEAETAATTAYDIVFVRPGLSATSPYLTPADGYSFAAPNQYLIGQGSTAVIPSVQCGSLSAFGTPTPQPLPRITNPLGPAIVINQAQTTVSGFEIVNSPIGIADAAGGSGAVSQVSVTGMSGASQTGILLSSSPGPFTFDRISLSDLSDDGFVIAANAAKVTITNSDFTSVRDSAVRVSGDAARVEISTARFDAVSNAVNASGTGALVTLADGSITNTAGDAIVASGAATIRINETLITDTAESALVASGADGRIVALNTTIQDTKQDAIEVSGNGAQVLLGSSKILTVGGAGAVVTGANATFRMNSSVIQDTGGDGVTLNSATGFVSITGVPTVVGGGPEESILRRIGSNGVSATGGAVQIQNTTIDTVAGAGILAVNAVGPTTNPNVTGTPGGINAVWVQGSTIRDATGGGILTLDSNLRVERLDRANLQSRFTLIADTGPIGIQATAALSDPAVLIDSTTITGVTTGIAAVSLATPAVPTLDLTVTNNNVTTTGGAGLQVTAAFDGPTLTALSKVEANIQGNRFRSTPDGIILTTAGGPTQAGVIIAPADQRPISVTAGSQANLSGINNGTNVVEQPPPDPGAIPPIVTSINYGFPAAGVALPPTPPAPQPSPVP